MIHEEPLNLDVVDQSLTMPHGFLAGILLAMNSNVALLQAIESIESSDLGGSPLRRYAMEQLAAVPNYDWCGIYRLESDGLVLDEFVGEPTDHSVIPIGQGVCGTAVKVGQNQVVEDVNSLENYLSCSIRTRAEIVVLIRNETGEILGQIDIDSHKLGAFGAEDESALESLAVLLASRWL